MPPVFSLAHNKWAGANPSGLRSLCDLRLRRADLEEKPLRHPAKDLCI